MEDVHGRGRLAQACEGIDVIIHAALACGVNDNVALATNKVCAPTVQTLLFLRCGVRVSS